MLFLTLNALLFGYLMSLFFVFDLIIFLRVLLSRNTEKKQFMTITVVAYEFVNLFILGIVLEFFWIYAASYMGFGYAGNYAPIITITRFAVIAGFIMINILAFFAPLRELIGITRVNLHNLGIPWWSISWANKYILLWKKDGKTERFYSALLTVIRYMFWLFLINIAVSMILFLYAQR